MPHPVLRDRPRTSAFPVYLPPGAAALDRLEPRMCHWPVGDVACEDFTFCGAPCGHLNYCPHHRRLALRGRR